MFHRRLKPPKCIGEIEQFLEENFDDEDVPEPQPQIQFADQRESQSNIRKRKNDNGTSYFDSEKRQRIQEQQHEIAKLFESQNVSSQGQPNDPSQPSEPAISSLPSGGANEDPKPGPSAEDSYTQPDETRLYDPFDDDNKCNERIDEIYDNLESPHLIANKVSQDYHYAYWRAQNSERQEIIEWTRYSLDLSKDEIEQNQNFLDVFLNKSLYNTMLRFNELDNYRKMQVVALLKRVIPDVDDDIFLYLDMIQDNSLGYN